MPTAYITFNGNTKEAFDLYATALYGKITEVNCFGQAQNSVPMSEALWGDYFGMFVDNFGIKWMINRVTKY